MQIFYIINGWAGNNPWLDMAMRGIYIAAIPFLATALTALLFFRPRRAGEYSEDAPAQHEPPASRIALAALLSLAACLLLFAVVQWAARAFLGAEILSPRPFVTHRVNALLVEPNDNSFPCIEAILAGALAVMLYAASRRLVLPILGATALALARVFCGANYPVDVVTGTLLGAALGALALSFCRVPLRSSVRRRIRVAWNPARQTALAAAALLLVCAAGAWSQNVGERWALHQNTASLIASTQMTSAHAIQSAHAAQSAFTPQNAHDEGESPAPIPVKRVAGFQTRDMPPPGVINLGGYLPRAEIYLRDVLLREKLPHALVSVDVAELRGDAKQKASLYRCASVRFAVARSGARERKAVTRTAQRIIKRAFQADAQLQNVDVAAVVLNRPPQASRLRVYAKGAVPVFTASVERQALRKKSARDGDAGSWLRARSRIYFNPRVLPAVDARLPVAATKPAPKPTTAASPTVKPKPTATPQKIVTPKIVAPVAPRISKPATPTKTMRRAPAKPPVAKPPVAKSSRPQTKSSLTKRRAPRARRAPQIHRAPQRVYRRTRRSTYETQRPQRRTRYRRTQNVRRRYNVRRTYRTYRSTR